MLDKVSHYLLFEQIGAGGMGTVYKAEDERDGKAVAVKVLLPHMVSDPAYVLRFVREAEAAQNLESPYLTRVLDSGRDGENHFVVMELQPGETLADLIQRRGRLPIGDVVTVANAIARALIAATSMNIVHQGISPQNVVITESGEVKIMGFGVSRDLTESSVAARRLLGGRPFYNAPELSLGSLEADVRADIYALGVTLFEMLVGSVPFKIGRFDDFTDAEVSQRIPNVRELRAEAPAWLAAVMYRCLARDPARRFQSPEEILAALAAADSAKSETSPVEVHLNARGRASSVHTRRWPEGYTAEGLAHWTRRKRLWLGSVAGTLLILALYGGLAVGSSLQNGEAGLPSPTVPFQLAADKFPTATATNVASFAIEEPSYPTFVVSGIPEDKVAPMPTATMTLDQSLPSAAAKSIAVSPSTTPAAVAVEAIATPTPPVLRPTSTVTAVDCAALATVADMTPTISALQMASGGFSCSKKAVSGVSMAALFSFGTSTARCDAISDDRGFATCNVGLQGATSGQFVAVSVCFTYQGTTYCSQAGFTPQ